MNFNGGPKPPHGFAAHHQPTLAVVLSSAALALPTLLAFNLPPSSTFLNQAAALVMWGAWLLFLTSTFSRSVGRVVAGSAALQGALGLLLVGALASPLWADLPWSLSLSSAALVGAAALVAKAATGLSRTGHALPAFRAFCIGMVVACALSSVVGIVQVFAPAWADGNFIARSYIEGRAVGNMRQPNHLSSLLLWGIVAAVWLGEVQVIRRWGSVLLSLLFLFVVVLSASRTGALSMGLLLLWGALDKRLSRHARLLLVLSPVIYGLFWYGTGVWADSTHHVFGGETRFSTQGDVSSSRLGIWSNTLALIRMHPWAGVGFGEFNFAWTLTPFPDRPVAFFDHTHNLVLQLLVELGLPLGLTVLGLLTFALVQAVRAAWWPADGDKKVEGMARADADTDGDGDVDVKAEAEAAPGALLLRPAACMMVLLIVVHSLLEYPLWYAYFLLPAAFAFGLCLAPRTAALEPALEATGPTKLRPAVVAALLLVMGGMASVVDYMKVVVIFAPPDGAPSLARRIDDGRRSIFFAHHADYAAATTAERPRDALPAFIRAPHYLLDARLLQAWAVALDQAGDTEHARYLAQRLREFRNEQSTPFFAPCAAPAEPGRPLPFQCTPPTRRFTFEDFR